uniref:Uncharacterized protein n=1 Tax=Ciona savignyi TaxID=51511 RepID=H2ZNG9_CIOSA
MVHSLIYTAFGMTILPVNFINGEPNNEQQRQPTEESIPHRENQTLNNSDHQTLRYNSERLVYHQCKEGSLHHQNYSCFTKLKCLVRPLQVMGGVLLCLFAWLIIITLALSNTNRYLSSHGIKTGYLAGNTSVVNPINYLLLQSNGVFPVHYLLLGGIAFYLAASSVAGMKYIGLRFLWKKIHNIEEGNTLPHAILFSSFVVSTVMVYTVILFYSLFPQYAMYGSQTYQVK